MSPDPAANRRPLDTRSAAWAQALAGALARSPITADQISVASIGFAAAGAWLLLAQPGTLGLIGCAVAIQLRLLCNLLDGMVAVEGGRKSAYGALYNELPDRVADTLFIVALGYAIGTPWLGWAGALAAMATAYVRATGAALGLAQDFRGPQAKPHRMFVMTVACLAAAAELELMGSQHALRIAAWIILVGSLLTIVRRTLAIARQLAQKPA